MNSTNENSKDNFLDRYRKLGIFKTYYLALFVCSLPIILILPLYIDQAFFNNPGNRIWSLFLLSLAPCGFIGIMIWIYGILKTANKGNDLNKVVGWLGFFFAMGLLLAGILGMMTTTVLSK